jgi:uncharacterized protein (DUF2267 family)
MSSTYVATFTQAAQQAQQWVNELAEDLQWSDRRRAYLLLRSVLHAVRDWLPQQEMADLSAQLPTLIRGIYFEGWKPLASPVADRNKDAFIRRIQRAFTDELLNDPDAAVSAVFRLLQRHVSGGEVEDVRSSMRKALRGLWPAD